MTDLRDWSKTLFPASYKGVPFFVDESGEEGGRNPVVHVFPNRDDPYIEDLGEEPRTFSVTAYVHGNAADAAATALVAALASGGSGLLVLPVRGPVWVQAQPFKRRDDKDRLGYVAFECKFIREGAGAALVSLPSLLNIAFGAVDALRAAVLSVLPAAMHLTGVPDFVSASAYSVLAAGAAAIDVARTSNAVDGAVSATVRDTVSAIVAASESEADVAALAADLSAAAGDLAAGMTPDVAVAAMLSAVDAFAGAAPPPAGYGSVNAGLAADNDRLAAQLVRALLIAAAAEALLSRTYASRQDGIAARNLVADYFDAEIENAAGADMAQVYVALSEARGRIIDYLSRVIADLAPVVTVSAQRIMPSLYWGWRLYGDPLRGSELVARNAVRHPSFMPESFLALVR